MKYSIYVEQIEEGVNYPDFAVEIQPPIGELAARGICRFMTRRASEKETNLVHYAEDACMTRSDAEGTVLFIHPNEELVQIDKESVAARISEFLDPVGLHIIVKVLD